MRLCFAADETVGRLAKWLRILGFDTWFEPDMPAGSFSGLEPDRILLTRRGSNRLQDRSDHPCVVIQSDHYRHQLLEVIRAVGMTADCIQPFSRCIRCNAATAAADKSDLQEKVPDYVWETHDVFSICPACRRVYWKGSHIERSMERIRRLFNA